MKTILTLLRPKFLSIKNSFTLYVLLRRMPFITIGVTFWVLLYLGASHLLDFIRGVELFGEVISKGLFSMIFFYLSGFLIISNIITSISEFYLSKDIPLLLTQPVNVQAIHRLKTAVTIAKSSWMVISFIPPVFIAYGVNYNAPWQFYIYLSITFLPFLLLPAGIGISIAHLLTRILPVKTTKNVLLALGFSSLLIIYFLIRFTTSDSTGAPEEMITTMLSLRSDSPLLPSYWITEATTPFLTGKRPDFLYPFLLFSSGAFFLVVSGWIGLKLYRANLDSVYGSNKKKWKGMATGYPPAGWAVLWKDQKIFFRDTEQWAQIFIIGALILIYVYNFRTIPLESFSVLTPFSREIIFSINMLLAGLVLTAISARFIYASISIEGRAFWVIRSSPTKIRNFLQNKFFYGFFPVTVTTLGVVLPTNMILGISGTLLYLSIATVIILCLTVCGLGIGFGALYPKFDYDSIASVSMSPGSLLFMLIAFFITSFTVSLEAFSLYLYRKAEIASQSLGLYEYSLIVLSMVLMVVLNTLSLYLPLRFGKKRLEGQ